MSSEAEIKTPPVINLPRPAGPHVVGVLDFELEDPERVEAYAPEQKRRIPVRACYPAAEKTAEPRAYATAQEREVFIGRFVNDMFQLPVKLGQAFDVPSNAY